MEVVGEVVDGPAMAQVDVLDEPGPLERFQAPVDRGPVEAGPGGLDGRRQVVGGEMALGRDEGLHDRTTTGGDALALTAEHVEDQRQPICVHQRWSVRERARPRRLGRRAGATVCSAAVPEPRVGTSGWSYSEWVGRFYPNGTSPARMLPFYAKRFPTVEAHSTYRRLPTSAALERWSQQVPPDFHFAPKAHMGITHRRDLDGVEERVAAFFDALAPLGSRLGPVLFAVPHQQPDLSRLDRLLDALPSAPRHPVAFELGPAWAVPEVISRLEAHGVGLAAVEGDGRPVGDMEIGPFTYVRLRRTRYDRSELDAWAERLRKASSGGRQAYAFFKHDEAGDGPRYARRVMGRLNSS